MVKYNRQVRISCETHRDLKIAAATNNMDIGELIEKCISFYGTKLEIMHRINNTLNNKTGDVVAAYNLLEAIKFIMEQYTFKIK